MTRTSRARMRGLVRAARMTDAREKVGLIWALGPSRCRNGCGGKSDLPRLRSPSMVATVRRLSRPLVGGHPLRTPPDLGLVGDRRLPRHLFDEDCERAEPQICFLALAVPAARAALPSHSL